MYIHNQVIEVFWEFLTFISTTHSSGLVTAGEVWILTERLQFMFVCLFVRSFTIFEKSKKTFDGQMTFFL